MTHETLDTIWRWTFSTTQPWDPPAAVVEAYAHIDGDQAARLATRAVEMLETSAEPDSQEAAVMLLTRLACVVPEALQGLHRRLLDCNVLDRLLYPMGVEPTVLFDRADPGTRDRLLELLEGAGDHRRAATVATALAWIRDDQVCEAFARWHDTPPQWAQSGPFGASEHLDWITCRAGWVLTAGDDLRLLYQMDGRRLVADGDTQTASVGGDLDKPCPWCRAPLTTLFDIALTDQRVAACTGVTGQRLVIPTCQLCVCQAVDATLYFDVDLAGAAAWSAANTPDGELLDESSEDRLPRAIRGLGQAIRSPFEPMAFAYDVEVTFLGGAPTWIENPRYPRCVTCEAFMGFVGQIDNHALDAVGEGSIYAFLDTACGTAATVYDQT